MQSTFLQTCFTHKDIGYLEKLRYGSKQITDLMSFPDQLHKVTSYFDVLHL